MKYKIYQQDVNEWAKEYTKGKFHALLSDAPYHLTSIVKRFGKKNSAPAQFGTDGVFSRSSKGFMGQEWDGGDVAFRPETWEALGEHLYPGGFGMVFSASRNWHRLAVAIEDAGMVIHPTIFGWLNGQGFPKATNIGKKLDYHDGGDNWEGHRYGLQALKPAVEPIIVFQKPYEGRPLSNIVETGAGAINIDGGRIPLNGDSYNINTFDDGAKPFGNGAGHKYTSRKVVIESDTHTYTGQEIVEVPNKNPVQGRWPANFILDESLAEQLDAQSGERLSGKSNGDAVVGEVSNGVTPLRRGTLVSHNDSGGASRFFYNVQEQIDEADPIYYCSKVNTNERNAGLEDLPDVQYAVSDGARKSLERGNNEYKQDSIVSNRVSVRKNNHPTMKPIALAKYLATLLLPPESYGPRRLLVPFSGVGSEMIGAMQAGWEQIVGIEFTPEYVDLAHKRIEYWRNK